MRRPVVWGISDLAAVSQLPLGFLRRVHTIAANNTRHASPRKRTRAGFLLPAFLA